MSGNVLILTDYDLFSRIYHLVFLHLQWFGLNHDMFIDYSKSLPRIISRVVSVTIGHLSYMLCVLTN